MSVPNFANAMKPSISSDSLTSSLHGSINGPLNGGGPAIQNGVGGVSSGGGMSRIKSSMSVQVQHN